jgi:hypothetical protein
MLCPAAASAGTAERGVRASGTPRAMSSVTRSPCDRSTCCGGKVPIGGIRKKARIA